MLTVELSAFFFFKQKTAYELRISDWSSDVCSSDLRRKRRRAKRSRLKAQPQRAGCLHPPLSGSGRWTLASILRWSVRPKAGASATAIWTAICAIPPTRRARLNDQRLTGWRKSRLEDFAAASLKKWRTEERSVGQAGLSGSRWGGSPENVK